MEAGKLVRMPTDLVSGMGLFPCSWSSDHVALPGASFLWNFISGRLCPKDLASSPNLTSYDFGFFF